jgi:polar amino acid transport system substrate-binding protein
LEKYPGILIRTYDSIPKALNAILNGTIDGAIVDILSAVAYCQDLYQGKLKIVTDPLNNEGLRMLSLHDQSQDLILHFNRGIEKLKSSGAYDKLLVKWNLKEKCTEQ